MFAVFTGKLGLIMPIIILQLLITSGYAGWSEASIVIDMNNMLRDTSTEVNTMPSTISSMASATSSSSSHRQMTENILRSDQKEHSVSAEKDALYSGYNEPSAELLRFVNDNEAGNSDEYANADSGFSGSSSSDSVDNEIHLASRQSRNTNDINNEDDNNDYMQSLSLRDQVRLLSKQLNVLMNRRREDYELLERNLRKSLRTQWQDKSPKSKTKHSVVATQSQNVEADDEDNNGPVPQNNGNDLDLRNELEALRQEVQELRNGQTASSSGNKERLTIEWLQQSVSELRKQLVELQQIASNAMRDVATRTQSWEDLTTIRSDFQQLKLELAALKEHQQQTDVYVQELREETQQQEEDYKRLAMHNKQILNNVTKDKASVANKENMEQNIELSSLSSSATTASVDLLADHKRRHLRFQRQQLHELQLSQRQLRRQFNELKYHRIGERVRSIEIEQHRIADANFNLSRQIASLDKLHSSMLELLEDVENVQMKVDKNLPELRHEISKLEFGHAQLMSEQNLVREEGKNVARSLQAMAVSVSTLQDERDGVRRMQSSVGEMRTQLDRLQTMVDDVQRALQHRQHRGAPVNKKFLHHRDNKSSTMTSNVHGEEENATQTAQSLVAKLENVEQQFESIIAKLPKDCSEVTPSEDAPTNDGLYMIAPTGDHHPQMAHCTADGWTSIQRRYDGSADFNRSWEDYANGFGSPAGEFWIGNEQLHHLTLNNCTQLRVLMQDIYDNVWLAEYGQFYISSRSDGYRLHIGGYSGNASDALDYQQGMQFSAIDVDRDISQTHCAANYEGGWWFSHCQHANLNGRYNLGLTWFDAQRNEWIAVKSSQMMIKRQSHETCNYVRGLAAATSTATTSTVSATTTATATATINSNKSIPLLMNSLRPSSDYSSESV
ncbi:protein scabrous [Stomoxys calcitrans]|uniref:protein scabrous n=1 Tax=Stomoxys calcitrans TaxID=35570 RepID=UPI0027E2F657|nr:protein scabrous [Stomoxys calcitrans]